MSENPAAKEGDPRITARVGEARNNGAATDQPGTGADSPAGEQDGGAKKSGSRSKAILLVAVVAALIIAIPWGLSRWHYTSTHVSTDDAYVAGNLVSVSPVGSGTLQELTVDEGSHVHRGQLIARLSDAGPQANLRQARANYNAALSQIPQAQRNLLYQQEATNAAIRKARAALGSQLAKTRGAEQQVSLVSSANRSQIRQAESQVGAAQALRQQSAAQAHAADVAVDNYKQAVQTAFASLESYQQQIVTAQKALQASQARVQAAQSEGDRTAKDEARYRVLYVQDAVSAQVYDNARAQARNAVANIQANQSQTEETQSQVSRREPACARRSPRWNRLGKALRRRRLRRAPRIVVLPQRPNRSA